LELNARRFEIQKEEVEQVDWFDIQDLFEDINMNPDKYVKSASVWHEIFADIT
jgi:isopentenyldiphosphate isomerase